MLAGNAEVNLMLSIAAGGCTPLTSFFQEKKTRKVEPAKEAGIEPVNVWIPPVGAPLPM
jgi:hypothetical protein